MNTNKKSLMFFFIGLLIGAVLYKPTLIFIVVSYTALFLSLTMGVYLVGYAIKVLFKRNHSDIEG